MNKKQKKMLFRILLSAALLIALHFAPFTGAVRFLAYMTSCAKPAWASKTVRSSTSAS